MKFPHYHFITLSLYHHYRVKGFGVRIPVLGLGFKVYGLGFRVKGLGFFDEIPTSSLYHFITAPPP